MEAQDIEKKLDLLYQSVEKTRKYFLWSLILQLAFIFLPLILLIFALPFFLGTYFQILEGLL